MCALHMLAVFAFAIDPWEGLCSEVSSGEFFMAVDDECSTKEDGSCALHALQHRQEVLSTAAGDAPKCKATSFTLTYGKRSGLFALPGEATEGDSIDQKCTFGDYTYPYGSVRFSCQGSNWHYASDSCSACEATTLSVPRGNASGSIDMPTGRKEGAEVKLPCSSIDYHGQAPYRSGLATFACQEGKWVLSSQRCASCAAVNFKLTYGTDQGTFDLPDSESPGSIAERPCNFDKSSYAMGAVKFECTASGWSYHSDTCAVCSATTLTLTQGNHSGEFKLPVSHVEGDKFKLPCTSFSNGDGPAYRHGRMTFACQQGNWTLSSQTCSACAKKKFRVAYGTDTGKFVLSSALNDGEIVAKPCEFGERKYSKGAVKFECSAGRWHLQAVTCKDQELKHSKS